MDEETATAAFDRFLQGKQCEIGEPLVQVPNTAQRLSAGWVFYYQSEAFIEKSDITAMLVGHGPVLIRDDGRIVEGDSLDHDPEALLFR